MVNTIYFDRIVLLLSIIIGQTDTTSLILIKEASSMLHPNELFLH